MLKHVISQMLHVFSQKTLEEGQSCFQQEHVLTVRLSEGLLKARVMGKTNQIFDVFLDFKSWPAQPSTCNCSLKVNCEHAAACLFALQAKEKIDIIPAFQDRLRTKSQEISSTQTYTPNTILSSDDVTWYSDSEEEPSANDFFSYQLGILINNQRVSIVPWVIAFIERYDIAQIENWEEDELIQLPLGDGRALELPVKRIRPLMRLLIYYGIKARKQQDDFRLSRAQLLFMQEAEQAMQLSHVRWQGTEKVREMLKQLLTQSKVHSLPSHFQAILRDYQHAGYSWLQSLRHGKFSGVLADDMGLGKTIQTLAMLQAEKEANRITQACLIIAPTSVIGNWKEEFGRFAPQLKILIYHGQDRYQGSFDDYDVIISTYGLVQRDKRRFIDYCFYYLILDEAQFIKNTQTKTRQIIQQLSANHRLCLTGTPIENHLGELWSLFHFLMPGLLGDRKQFRLFFKNPIEKNNDESRRQLLMKRIQPFLLRRTKNEVAQELPQKTEITQLIELVGSQRDLYETIRMTTESSVREAIARQGLGKSHFILLDALLKLRQICCDPRLLKMPELPPVNSSAKLEACLELLDNLMQEGRSVLVFSQFTSMLSLIEKELIARQYSYLKLTGKTQNRATLIQRFQNGEAPIFLISLKAGGTGLNLTQADTVIHYDPWWNPAVEDQATDRSHRIGQTKPVFVYRLITTGTVEETMMSMQMRKRALFNDILSNHLTQSWNELSDEDIDTFFAPLTEEE